MPARVSKRNLTPTQALWIAGEVHRLRAASRRTPARPALPPELWPASVYSNEELADLNSPSPADGVAVSPQPAPSNDWHALHAARDDIWRRMRTARREGNSLQSDAMQDLISAVRVITTRIGGRFLVRGADLEVCHDRDAIFDDVAVAATRRFGRHVTPRAARQAYEASRKLFDSADI